MSEYVELYGGPSDGVTMAVQEPLPQIVIPVLRRPLVASYTAAELPAVADAAYLRARYRRDVISDVTHRWKYRYEGMS
jgi:hypothetical protein